VKVLCAPLVDIDRSRAPRKIQVARRGLARACLERTGWLTVGAPLLPPSNTYEITFPIDVASIARSFLVVVKTSARVLPPSPSFSHFAKLRLNSRSSSVLFFFFETIQLSCSYSEMPRDFSDLGGYHRSISHVIARFSVSLAYGTSEGDGQC